MVCVLVIAPRKRNIPSGEDIVPNPVPWNIIFTFGIGSPVWLSYTSPTTIVSLTCAMVDMDRNSPNIMYKSRFIDSQGGILE